MNPEITELDKKIMKRLQDSIPSSLRPYKEIADDAGVGEDEVIRRINLYKEKKWIRRFGATLRHQKAGFKFNGMGVWKVPNPDDRQRLGEEMAAFHEVSHCYERPSYEDWPYNLFTMIHGESQRECEEVARRISEKTGLKEYTMLYSSREFKKSSMKYFP
ncbi:MAG: Lrp/AsnC family transcriptional regulator [Nitrospinae bacterium]|nr:Lrp/AsnC family transcriptional regulator [Nitrospinota bacterium]